MHGIVINNLQNLSRADNMTLKTRTIYKLHALLTLIKSKLLNIYTN